VTGWALLFLGIIALGTLIMAAIQVGAVIYAGRLARRIDRLSNQIECEIKPVLASVGGIASDAARAADLAVKQVERADHLFADLALRLEETVAGFQAAVAVPLREGTAVAAGVRAALAALKGLRRRSKGRPPATEEEALFIG
jgi:hypothetical protein